MRKKDHQADGTTVRMLLHSLKNGLGIIALAMENRDSYNLVPARARTLYKYIKALQSPSMTLSEACTIAIAFQNEQLKAQGNKDTEISTEIDPGIKDIHVNPHTAIHTLENPIGNAIKHIKMADKKTIHVSIQKGDGTIIFSVTDNNPGTANVNYGQMNASWIKPHDVDVEAMDHTQDWGIGIRLLHGTKTIAKREDDKQGSVLTIVISKEELAPQLKKETQNEELNKYLTTLNDLSNLDPKDEHFQYNVQKLAKELIPSLDFSPAQAAGSFVERIAGNREAKQVQIIIIDDNCVNCLLLSRQILKKLPSAKIYMFSNLPKIEKGFIEGCDHNGILQTLSLMINDIDLIIVDEDLAREDKKTGSEWLNEHKDKFNKAEVKTMLYTGDCDGEIKNRAYTVGAPLLRKPVTTNDIESMINLLLPEREHKECPGGGGVAASASHAVYSPANV